MSGPIFASDVEGCQLVVLEGLTLLFHPRSGMTHILAPPSPEILDALREGPADGTALLARLRSSFDFPEGPDAGAAIAARLAELEASGLVRRA